MIEEEKNRLATMTTLTRERDYKDKIVPKNTSHEKESGFTRNNVNDDFGPGPGPGSENSSMYSLLFAFDCCYFSIFDFCRLWSRNVTESNLSNENEYEIHVQ